MDECCCKNDCCQPCKCCCLIALAESLACCPCPDTKRMIESTMRCMLGVPDQPMAAKPR